MRRKKHEGTRLLCLALVLAQAAGIVLAQDDNKPDPLAKRVQFLNAEVNTMRQAKGGLSAEQLKRSLSAKSLSAPAGKYRCRVCLELLLKASILVNNLDARAYNEPYTKTRPEDVAKSKKVYNIDLFNSLLGEDRQKPARDHNGKTALMYAAEANQLEVLRTLLLLPGKVPFEPLYKKTDDKGHKYIDWCDKDGYTALMYASAAGSVEAVNYLINAGADINTHCEVAQFTASELAQNAGHGDIVDAIEKKRNEIEAATEAAGWWAGQWWKGLVTNHEVVAPVLWGLLAWGFYLVIWRVRWQIRLGRAHEETLNLVDSDERLQKMPTKEKGKLAASISSRLLKAERFRSRRKVVPDEVKDADKSYVRAEYYKIRDAVLSEQASLTTEGRVAGNG